MDELVTVATPIRDKSGFVKSARRVWGNRCYNRYKLIHNGQKKTVATAWGAVATVFLLTVEMQALYAYFVELMYKSG